MTLGMTYAELINHAATHRKQLEHSADEQLTFIAQSINSVKFTLKNDANAEPHLQAIQAVEHKLEQGALNRTELDALINHLKSLAELEKNFYGQDWYTSKMEAAGYQLTGFGQCLGITYMATQAFLLGQQDVFNKRLETIYDLPLRYFQNHFEAVTQHIQSLRENHESSEAEQEQQQLNDIKAFFDGVALYAAARLHKDWFGVENPRNILNQQPFEKTMPLVLPDALTNQKENTPTFMTSFSTHNSGELNTFFKTLASTLSDESFAFHIKACGHIIGLFYDAANKKWYHANPDQLPMEEINDSSVLAEIVLNDFKTEHKSTMVALVDLYTQQKYKKSVESKLAVLAKDEHWNQAHPDNPFKDTLRPEIVDSLLQHHRVEWFEEKLGELDDDRVFNVLLEFTQNRRSIIFTYNEYPENIFDDFNALCMSRLSPQKKLAFAAVTGDEETCKKLLEEGTQPTIAMLEGTAKSVIIRRDPIVRYIIRLLIQHLPPISDSELCDLYTPPDKREPPGAQLITQNEVLIDALEFQKLEVPESLLNRAIQSNDSKMLRDLFYLESQVNITENSVTLALESELHRYAIKDILTQYFKEHQTLSRNLLKKVFLDERVDKKTLDSLVKNHHISDTETLIQSMALRKASTEQGKEINAEAIRQYKEQVSNLRSQNLTEDQLNKINDLINTQTEEQNHHPAQLPTLKASIAALTQFKKLTQTMDILSAIRSIETEPQFQRVFQDLRSKTQELVDEIKSEYISSQLTK